MTLNVTEAELLINQKDNSSVVASFGASKKMFFNSFKYFVVALLNDLDKDSDKFFMLLHQYFKVMKTGNKKAKKPKATEHYF